MVFKFDGLYMKLYWRVVFQINIVIIKFVDVKFIDKVELLVWFDKFVKFVVVVIVFLVVKFVIVFGIDFFGISIVFVLYEELVNKYCFVCVF